MASRQVSVARVAPSKGVLLARKAIPTAAVGGCAVWFLLAQPSVPERASPRDPISLFCWSLAVAWALIEWMRICQAGRVLNSIIVRGEIARLADGSGDLPAGFATLRYWQSSGEPRSANVRLRINWQDPPTVGDPVLLVMNNLESAEFVPLSSLRLVSVEVQDPV